MSNDHKKIFSENLNKYLVLSGKTQKDLIDNLKFDKSSVSTWCNGTKMPRMDKIQALANYFGIEISDLIEKKQSTGGNLYETIKYVKTIPVLGYVPGGAPMLAMESHESYTQVTDPNLDFALRVVGNSMINARIADGDMVFVDKDAEIINGDVVVALINEEEATVKRFYQYGNLIVLRPENPSEKEMEYSASQVRLLGKVKKVVYEI